MPPPNKAPAELDQRRIGTWAGNANTHPGTAAKNTLRAQNPPWDPEVIQKEKAEKNARKAVIRRCLPKHHAVHSTKQLLMSQKDY